MLKSRKSSGTGTHYLFEDPAVPMAHASIFVREGRVTGAIDGIDGLRTFLTSIEPGHSRVEFRRARVEVDATATLRVALHPSISSGALRSVLESNALAELAAQPRRWEAGEVVPVHLFGGGFA